MFRRYLYLTTLSAAQRIQGLIVGLDRIGFRLIHLKFIFLCPLCSACVISAEAAINSSGLRGSQCRIPLIKFIYLDVMTSLIYIISEVVVPIS